MIKLKSYTAFFFIILTMASCQFSENCDYTGDVQLTMDWESLWGNLQKPDSLNVLFYKNAKSPLRKNFYGYTTDTIYNNIPSGNTNMIIFNKPEDVQLHNPSELSNAELRLPTYFEGNIKAVNECPMICEVNSDILVPIESMIQQSISPLPIVKQLIFVVNVIREGVTGELANCNASLSGIPTGYSLSRGEATETKATVFFSLPKDKGDLDSFSHSFFVLGINRDQPDRESTPKKLSLSISLDDGEIKNAEFDLTEQLNEFTSNIFKCEVTVRITAMSTTIEIISWEQGVWNQIIIQ